MSRIEKLRTDILEASEAIARAERIVAEHPDIPSALVTLRSTEKRKAGLEEQFLEAAREIGQDACSYRIEYDPTNGPNIAGLAAAIGLFQEILTNVYHALKNGPKQRARPSTESVDATTLEFAYTFPGSVGFMMTLRNESMLFGESDTDMAMRSTLDLLSASTFEELEELTPKVGLPAIRLAHQWAQENAKAGFGADIKWRPSPALTRTAHVQPQQVVLLASTLALMTAKEQIVVAGDLIHVNMTDNTFEMKVGGKTIHGRFDKAISERRPASLPQRYIAKLTVATKVATTEGQEDISYFLDSLEPYDPSSPLLSSTELL